MTLGLQDTVRNKCCTREILGFVDECRRENLVSSSPSTLPRWPATLFKCQSLLSAGRRNHRLGEKRGLFKTRRKARCLGALSSDLLPLTA